MLYSALWHRSIKTRMAKNSPQRARRRQALSAQGASHPHLETVTDSLFRDSAFFDPNDLVQIKYEMLRSVQKEGRAVVEAPKPLACPARSSMSLKRCSSAKACRGCYRASAGRSGPTSSTTKR